MSRGARGGARRLRVVVAGVIMVALGVAWSQVAARQAEEAERRALAPTSLKVVTWNLNWLHQSEGEGPTRRTHEDYDKLASYARQLDADLYLVQEIDGEEAARKIFDPERYAFHVSSRDHLQRVAIVYRKTLRVERHPDLVALARVQSERLRYGVDLSVYEGEAELRVLAVHLKSGCFSSPLHGPYRQGESEDACKKLETQLPILTRWMQRRATERTPFMVMGDFNRRLKVGDEVWERLNAGVPEAGLSSPTSALKSPCWGGLYPELIDHIVLDTRARTRYQGAHPFIMVYQHDDEARHGHRLSDHCPVGLQR